MQTVAAPARSVRWRIPVVFGVTFFVNYLDRERCITHRSMAPGEDCPSIPVANQCDGDFSYREAITLPSPITLGPSTKLNEVPGCTVE